MADELVRRAQKFVNQTYGSRIGMTVTEDGQTGWNTMYALTRALQYELGITSLSNSFGPTTLSTLQSKYPKLNASTVPSADFCRIIQSALYCKGYDGGEIDGIYNSRVQDAVTKLKSDMGVDGAYPGSDVYPKVFKALLNMDPYVLVDYGTAPGSDSIRAIQRWLNGRYIARQDFFIIPCDGHHSRDVAKSMLFAIQYELGMADGVANGVFGPGTQSGLKSHTLSTGSTGTWVSLFTAALILNQRTAPFTSSFTSTVADATTGFQTYAALPRTATADFATWASLLVSYGDQTRSGTACDCVTSVTSARAATLKSAGYKYIGRYLCNVPNTTLDKVIKFGELATIADAGLNCFPIYQTFGGSSAYFTYNQGTADAYAAIEWARYHGFKDGTRIYFAVDYDALDADVTSSIIPHFRGIYQVIMENSRYRVGVYGARNVCQRVSGAGYADASFVSDMSSGFSGNLGYPLPNNWAFDQIATVGLGLADGYLEIDKDIASGLDTGQNTFDPGGAVTDGLDVAFDTSYRDTMLQEVRTYLTSIGVPETGGDGWTDSDWATLGGISSTEAFNRVVGMDALFTSLARQLKLRKSLIQAPVLWELRKFNPLDPVADEAVKNGLKDDSSTGWGQIFGWVAIEARNYCMQQGIINGSRLLVPGTGGDLKTVWTQLNQDPVYNIQTAAYLTIYNAHQLGLARPGLSTSDADNQKIIARYNGTGSDADQYGREVGGLSQVLEKYYKIARGQ